MTGVRWCVRCVLDARARGTVRDLQTEVAIVYVVPQCNGRLEWTGRGICTRCGADSVVWEVRAETDAERGERLDAERRRGLGRSPREPAQLALPLGHRGPA